MSLWGSRFLIDCCLPLCSEGNRQREREREKSGKEVGYDLQLEERERVALGGPLDLEGEKK